jgi:hypothetical protein
MWMVFLWVVAPCSLVESDVLMVEAARTSEALANFYQTTGHSSNAADNRFCTHCVRHACSMPCPCQPSFIN